MRPSGTEPIVRLIAEAPTTTEAEALIGAALVLGSTVAIVGTAMPLPLVDLFVRREERQLDREAQEEQRRLGQAAEALDGRRGLLLVEIHPRQHRLLDLLVGAAEAFAVLAQHVELAANELRRAAEDVARIGVLRDQAQRLSLTAPADHDRHSRAAD